jgi:biopolymer transport protein ExbD
MGMNVGSSSGSGDPEPMMEINTTPLIDVMLVLIIMLIITIPIQTHAVKLDMPRPHPNDQPTVPPEVVNLEVDFDGTILWNGTVVSMDTLDSYLDQAAKKDPQPEVHLRPSKLAKYKYVASVMAAAQRLGVMKIGIVGNEQFLQ